MQTEAAPVDNIDTGLPQSESTPSTSVPSTTEVVSDQMQEDTKIEETHEKEAENLQKEQHSDAPKDNKESSPCKINCLLCSGKASIKETPPSMKETIQTSMLLLALNSLQNNEDKASFDLNVITQYVRQHERFGISSTSLPGELSLKFRLAMLLTQPEQGTFGKVETPTLAHFFGYDPLVALPYLKFEGIRFNTSDLKTEPEPSTNTDTNMNIDTPQPPEATSNNNVETPTSADGETDITPLLQKLLTLTAKLKVEEQQLKEKKPATSAPAPAANANGQAKPKPKPISAKRRTPPSKHAKKNSESGLVVDLRGPEFTVHDKGEDHSGGCEWGCELCKGDIRLLKTTTEILWRDSVGYVLALLMTSEKSLNANRTTFFLNEMMNFVYTHKNPPLTSSEMHGRDLSCRMLSAMNNNPNVFGRIGELYQYEYYLKQPRKLAQSLFQFVEGYNFDKIPENISIASSTPNEAETKKRKPELIDTIPSEKKKKVKAQEEEEEHPEAPKAKSKIPLKKRLSVSLRARDSLKNTLDDQTYLVNKDWNDDTDNEETPMAATSTVFSDTMNDADLIKAIQQQADLLVQSVSQFGKVATEIAATIKRVTQENLSARQENMQLLQQLNPKPATPVAPAPTTSNETQPEVKQEEESDTDTEAKEAAASEPIPAQV